MLYPLQGPTSTPPLGLSREQALLPGADSHADEDSDSMSSDPAALVEDALLGELFFHDLAPAVSLPPSCALQW